MGIALVTGVYGFLGRPTEFLSEQGYQVSGIGHAREGAWADSKFRQWGLSAFFTTDVCYEKVGGMRLSPRLIGALRRRGRCRCFDCSAASGLPANRDYRFIRSGIRSSGGSHMQGGAPFERVPIWKHCMYPHFR